MAKCSKCGFEAGSSKFCPECGNKIDQIKHCPNCGAVVTGKFCGECGTMWTDGASGVTPSFGGPDISLGGMPELNIDLSQVADLSSSMVADMTAKAQKSADYVKTIDRARALCIRRRYSEAKAIYEAILDEDMNDMNAYMGLLRVASENYVGTDPEALEALEIARAISGKTDLTEFDPDFEGYKWQLERHEEWVKEQAEREAAAEAEKAAQNDDDNVSTEHKSIEDELDRIIQEVYAELDIKELRDDHGDEAYEKYTTPVKCTVTELGCAAEGFKLYQERKFKEALPLLEKYAHENKPAVLNAIGWCYLYGMGGVLKESKKSIPHLKKAADMGYVPAKFNLAVSCLFGWGQKRDTKKAFALFGEVASTGHIAANIALAMCYRHGKGCARDYDTALKYLQKGLDAGDPWALCRYGEMFHKGQGVKTNNKRAFELYGEAAAKDCAYGYRKMAYCYEMGKGAPQDYNKMVECTKKAADLGDVYACNRYSYWAHGYGIAGNIVGENHKLALHYELMKVENGHADISSLKYLYNYGKGVQNEKEASRWEQIGKTLEGHDIPLNATDYEEPFEFYAAGGFSVID